VENHLRETPISTISDDLGCFRPRDVPLLFPAEIPQSARQRTAEPRSTRVALYLRISTRADKRDDPADAAKRKRQEVDNQRRQLREFCEAQGWQIVAEYADEESGSKSDRDAFRQMWRDAAQRKFDVLLFWALDRLSREGVLETLNYLQRLDSWGIGWKSFTEQYLDSTGMFRDAVIAILAAVAKQERVRISERTKAGLARAKEKGTRSGQPIGRPRLVFRRDQVVELRKQGLSWRQIALRLHASPTAVRRVHKAEAGASVPCPNRVEENSHV